NADEARDLALLRQRPKLAKTPRLLVADRPGEFQPPGRRIYLWCLADIVEGIEARRAGDFGRPENRRQRGRIEQSSLHFVVPARHQPQKLIRDIRMVWIVVIAP